MGSDCFHSCHTAFSVSYLYLTTLIVSNHQGNQCRNGQPAVTHGTQLLVEVRVSQIGRHDDGQTHSSSLLGAVNDFYPVLVT